VEAAARFLIESVQLRTTAIPQKCKKLIQTNTTIDLILETEEIFTTRHANELINVFLTCFSLGIEYLVVALIYMERVIKKNQDLVLTYTNMKNLLYLSLTIAAKFHEDKFEKQTIFSAVSGLTRKQFRQVFDLFLDLIDFDLKVEEEEYYCLMS
jgi:hypothetical protein